MMCSRSNHSERAEPGSSSARRGRGLLGRGLLGLAALALSLLSCLGLAQPGRAQGLRAGAARVDITPKDIHGGFVLIGTRQVKGVHDRLFARALVVGSGSSLAAIVSVDLVEYGDSTSLRRRIEAATAIPAASTIIAATHNHSAPRGGPVTPGTSSATQGRPWSNDGYLKQAEDGIFDAVVQAKAAMQPALLAYGKTHADVGANYHRLFSTDGGGKVVDNDFPYDRTVWVVRLSAAGSGEPIAVLMNVAVHSNAEAGSGDGMIAADLAGVAERTVEHQFGDKAVALWTMGAAADIYPVLTADSDRSGDPEAAYTAQTLLGGTLGAIVAQEARQLGRQVAVSDVTVHASQRAVSCALNPQQGPPAGMGPRAGVGPAASGLDARPGAAAGAGSGGGSGAGPAAGAGAGQHAGPPMGQPADPRIKTQQITPGETLPIQLSLLRLNQLAITGVSGEISTAFFADFQKVSPFADTMMITLANDRDGYIPDEVNWDHWGNGAFVQGCAEPAILHGLVGMMDEGLRR